MIILYSRNYEFDTLTFDTLSFDLVRVACILKIDEDLLEQGRGSWAMGHGLWMHTFT